MIYAFWQAGLLTSMLRVQDKLVATWPKGARWHRVGLRRPEDFVRHFRMCPFQARAVLIEERTYLRLLGEFNDGETFDFRFTHDTMQVHWMGNRALGSSNLHWFMLSDNGRSVILTADTNTGTLNSRQATVDIVRMIAPSYALPELATHGFRIETSLPALSILLLTFVILFLAAFEGFVWNPYSLVGILPVIHLVLIAPPFVLAAYFFMLHHTVPSSNAMTLAAVFGLGIMVAGTPVLMRLDQFLDTDGPQPYTYTLGERSQLHAIGSDAPSLKVRQHSLYWNQIKRGSQYELTLIHGPLGLWQVDLRPLKEKYAAFNQELKADPN